MNTLIREKGQEILLSKISKTTTISTSKAMPLLTIQIAEPSFTTSATVTTTFYAIRKISLAKIRIMMKKNRGQKN